MKQASFILSAVTDNSLVVIDELGRGTSTTDGTSISITLCEYLLRKNCLVYFATHFTRICDYFKDNCHVGVLHLQVESHLIKVTLNNSSEILKYDYRLKNGASKVEHYGIELAKRVGFQDDVVEKALEISQMLEKSWKDKQESSREYLKAKQTQIEVSVCFG
jgi:DNA mismatch repair protein MSH4